jgi:hypothetical protein
MLILLCEVFHLFCNSKLELYFEKALTGSEQRFRGVAIYSPSDSYCPTLSMPYRHQMLDMLFYSGNLERELYCILTISLINFIAILYPNP